MDGEKSERANLAQYGELDNFCFTPCHILIMYFFVFLFLFLFFESTSPRQTGKGEDSADSNNVSVLIHHQAVINAPELETDTVTTSSIILSPSTKSTWILFLKFVITM